MNANAQSGAIVLGVIFLDQFSKMLVAARIFPAFVSRQTSGIVFGYDLPGSLDFYLVAVFLAMFVYWHFRYLRRSPASVGSALIVGGAVSNLLDRLGDGTVVDFLNLGLSTMNVADLAILAGIGILAYKL